MPKSFHSGIMKIKHNPSQSRSNNKFNWNATLKSRIFITHFYCWFFYKFDMSMLSTLSQRLLNYSIKKSLTKLRWLGELSQIVLHHFICPVHWRSTLCPFVTKDVYPKENRENYFSTVLISSWNHKNRFEYSQWAWIKAKIAEI